MKRLLLLTTILCCLTASAADLYVTPDSSLTDAVRKAREMRRLGQATDVTIHLAAGIYQLYEPLRLRPEDSGLKIVGPATVPDGFPSGPAIISGGLRISNWKKQGKLLVADVPDFNGRPVDFRQLWVNGRKAIRARDIPSVPMTAPTPLSECIVSAPTTRRIRCSGFPKLPWKKS